MATTVIEVKYKNSGAPVVFNNEVTNPAATGVVIPDLLDDTGAATGYTLTHPGPFSGATGSSSWATSSPDPNFPLEFFRSAFYASDAEEASATPIIGNLPNGATFTLQVAGNNTGTDRDTNFTASNGSPAPALYDVAGSDPVTAPVEISGTVSGGQIALSMNGVGTLSYLNGFRLAITTVDGPSITTADDITSEGQTATFTLSGNSAAPESATLNGTDVGTLTDQGSGVYSYTAPLIADDDTADLVVSVDGTTAGATIAYANSYDRDQLTHPATEAEYSENSLSYPNAYATTQAYEWKVIADANAAVVTINWNALEADDGFHKDVSSYATPVANGSTTVTLGVFVPETGQAYQFDRTITVSDGSVVVEGEGLFRSLFSALEKPLFKPLFR